MWLLVRKYNIQGISSKDRSYDTCNLHKNTQCIRYDKKNPVKFVPLISLNRTPCLSTPVGTARLIEENFKFSKSF